MDAGLAEWKPKGRPRHSQHTCNHCAREFSSANKKRDHQKRCTKEKESPMLAIKSTKTLNPKVL